MAHNAYGPHEYLLPVLSETTTFSKARAVRYWFDTIAECATTATATQILQLLHCTVHTLPVLQEKLQIQPFLIRVTKGGFQLHAKDVSAIIQIFPAQDITPPTWHGSGHDVITLQAKDGIRPLRSFDEMAWPFFVEALKRA